MNISGSTMLAPILPDLSASGGLENQAVSCPDPTGTLTLPSEWKTWTTHIKPLQNFPTHTKTIDQKCADMQTRIKLIREVLSIQLFQSVPEVLENVLKSLNEHGEMKHQVQSELTERQEDPDDPFFVVDLGSVIRQHRLWQQYLPEIKPFYAVKCNPDPLILKSLIALGVGFDCASKVEIKTLLDLGAHPSKIIYANACKQASHLKYALSKGVDAMTFDNEDELIKIKRIGPGAKLILRVLADDSRSLCKLGLKFGAPVDSIKPLLEKAKALELQVVGISFHVGSGCFDASAFTDAVRIARMAFLEGLRLGFPMRVLDVGGGFPGGDKPLPVDDALPPPGPYVPFPQIAVALREAIEADFYQDADFGDATGGPMSRARLQIISEPGRFYVAGSFTLATRIYARRVIHTEHQTPRYMYYIPEGVYGSFNCTMFDHATVIPRVLKRNNIVFPKDVMLDQDGNLKNGAPASIWGPTCDSMDRVIEACNHLPVLEEGDWLVWEFMGAYTSSAASKFNGFATKKLVYTNSEVEGLRRMLELEDAMW